ncbi:hypothetical protein L211DRAFT_851174 [Terfezia boudieri ATCC MYA-4762]|uniref:PD-(D/E)XK nuclease-like domain-containing protein n=1 Tax=Terfezia boudieri ATCC MYA-4762 TaxID=1051890 RepID=A0A3N4LUJ9_9PEZI|nr:hypothetical protein L211DRAFT_851174 [Terfezia boudieri ATCC MYA-4762]
MQIFPFSPILSIYVKNIRAHLVHGKARGAIKYVVRSVLHNHEGVETSDYHPQKALPGEAIILHCGINSEQLPYDPNTGHHIKAAKVDLLVGYNWTEQPLKDFLSDRPELPMFFTPLKQLQQTFLGAVPVEVKNATGDSTEARYQLAICASAMLRLRQMWAKSQKKEYDPGKPPVVVGLSVIGHVWSYYVTYLGKPYQKLQYRAIACNSSVQYMTRTEHLEDLNNVNQKSYNRAESTIR